VPRSWQDGLLALPFDFVHLEPDRSIAVVVTLDETIMSSWSDRMGPAASAASE
jgi:hypothetical protein